MGLDFFPPCAEFDAFTGQRPYSTIAKLRVEQFSEALKLEKPVVHVQPAQDKIRMEHYITLHPQLARVVGILGDGRDGSDRMLILESFCKWMQTSYRYRGLTATSSQQIFESSLSSMATSSGGTNRIVPIY